jgi:hypothetical protein
MPHKTLVPAVVIEEVPVVMVEHDEPVTTEAATSVPEALPAVIRSISVVLVGEG